MSQEFRVEPIGDWPRRRAHYSTPITNTLRSLGQSQKLVVPLNGRALAQVASSWYSAGRHIGLKLEIRRVGNDAWIRLKPEQNENGDHP